MDQLIRQAVVLTTNKDPYILTVDGLPGQMLVTAINLKTCKQLCTLPFTSVQMLSDNMNKLFVGDLKGVILSLCFVTLPGFSTQYELFKAVKELFVKRNVPVYNCAVKRIAWTTCFIAANISVEIGDKILVVMVHPHALTMSRFQFTKNGYKVLNDETFDMPEDLNVLRDMIYTKYDAKKTIITSLLLYDDVTADMKKILRSSDTVIVDRMKHVFEAPIAMYNWFKDRSGLKYITLPSCDYKHQFGFKFGGKDYPLINVESETSLPFTQTVELPRSSLVFYIGYKDQHTQKMEYTNIISMKNAAHRRQISFTLNEQHLSEYSAKPIILDPIKSLPDSLKAGGQKEIPIVAFFDNSSVICAWNDEKNEYGFLDTWNDMYGFELLIGFNTQKPCYGAEAAAAMRAKPTFVVSDLLNIISQSKKKPFHPYGFKVTADNGHPVLLECDTYDKSRKAASPGSFLGMLLKEHKRLIEEKSGFTPSKIGFCLPMMKEENERMILVDAIEESFKLVNVESFVIDI